MNASHCCVLVVKANVTMAIHVVSFLVGNFILAACAFTQAVDLVPNMHVRWLPIVRPASLTQGVDLVPNKHVRWLPILMHGTLFFDAFRKKSLVVMVVHYKRKNKHILMCGALNYPTQVASGEEYRT